jgi:xanthine/CO dehydrogenase XdhC/CoxF family maturation factor
MKNWQETNAVYTEMARLRDEGRKSALAVIVRIKGSAYRLPGAKLLIRDDGTLLGNVSGGCLENDVRELALQVIKNGDGPRLVHYDTSGREDMLWGLGVGCNGELDVLIQPGATGGLRAATDEVCRLARGDRPFSIATVLAGPGAGNTRAVSGEAKPAGSLGSPVMDAAGDAAAARRLEAGRAACETISGVEVFLDVLLPPPRLVVCGAGDDAAPLVRLAAEAGFRVTVVDHRPAYADRSRFPAADEVVCARPEDAGAKLPSGAGVMAVVMCHLLALDRGWVQRFAADEMVRYVGLLGARARREDIVSGVAPERRRCVFGPVGLDLGAEGPEQIAVSIVAELMAVRAGREPGHLRDREAPIHEKEPGLA